MNFRIQHKTTYNYPKDVSISHNLAHLNARAAPGQVCLKHDLAISVPPAVSIDQTDFFGNPVTFFTIQAPHRGLSVSATNIVSVQPVPPPDPASTPPWESVVETLRADRDPATLDAYQFTFDSPLIKDIGWLAVYARLSLTPGRPLLEACVDLTTRIFTDFRYDSTATTTSTPLTELFKLRRGVCQDFAHLQIACLRSLGLAARYVSGYLQTLPPPRQPRLIGADASHAWLSVFIPGPDPRWVDLDPTNDVIPGDKHITLAWGRDFDDVSPIKGVILGGGRHSLAVSVDVEAIGDATE